MLPKQNTLASLLKTGLLTVLLLAAAAPLQAQDKKADPTGTWVWTSPARGQAPERKNTLKFKIDGDKLTAKLITPGRNGDRETEITDAKVKGDEITFSVTTERNGNKMTTKYTGKIGADSIKGKR